MGTVWMAQQTEPVKRLVAVKLIKRGMDSWQVLARSETERQALALMDHPNIAKALDAGTTGKSEPRPSGSGGLGVPVANAPGSEGADAPGLGVPVADAPGSEGADAPGSEYPVANTPGSD
jgi:serine/threonine protein kinase